MRKDKIQHSIVCCALVIIGARFNIFAGVILALLFAFGKELWDSTRESGWDWEDIWADLLGIIMGVIIA